MERRVFMLGATGTALAVLSPRRAEGSSMLTRITSVSGFSVFAGPRLVSELRQGSSLRVIRLESNRAHAAVCVGEEQIGTIALDSLGIMSCRVPTRARVHRLEKNAAGKHQMWIECDW